VLDRQPDELVNVRPAAIRWHPPIASQGQQWYGQYSVGITDRHPDPDRADVDTQAHPGRRYDDRLLGT
jgi:hypothetical protein